MRLYHGTTLANAEQVASNGFQDATSNFGLYSAVSSEPRPGAHCLLDSPARDVPSNCRITTTSIITLISDPNPNRIRPRRALVSRDRKNRPPSIVSAEPLSAAQAPITAKPLTRIATDARRTRLPGGSMRATPPAANTRPAMATTNPGWFSGLSGPGTTPTATRRIDTPTNSMSPPHPTDLSSWLIPRQSLGRP